MTEVTDPGLHRAPAKVIGRYALYAEIASGGMASVHVARLLGPVGFSRTVAIKRLHPHLAKEPDFVAMFLDEARLAARIRHPNVVPTLDVVAEEGELFLVMEYVNGESLSQLLRAVRANKRRMPPPVVAGIMAGVLHGLHAAHEARSERGAPLDIVHRDMSPQNVLVGVNGVAQVVDFGVAKAIGRLQSTRDGMLKGKLPYMAPEQMRGDQAVTRAVDLFAAGAVFWEALVGRRLFKADSDAEVMHAVLYGTIEPPSRHAPVPRAVDDIVMRALQRDPSQRFATAHEMAMAIEKHLPPSLPSRIGAWVVETAADNLTHRSRIVEEIESISSVVDVPELCNPAVPVPAPAPAPSASAATEPGSVAGTQPRLDSQVSSVSLPTPPAASSKGIVLGAAGMLAVVGAAAGLYWAAALRAPAQASPAPAPCALLPTAPAASVPAQAPSESAAASASALALPSAPAPSASAPAIQAPVKPAKGSLPAGPAPTATATGAKKGREHLYGRD